MKLYEYIDDWHTSDGKEHIYEVHEVSDNKSEAFLQAYKFERSLRYCNGYHVKFDDATLDNEYLDWKRDNVDINLFYGGLVYD